MAFSLDPLTKYYACLAICALVSNKQFEAAVHKSGTLGLVDPFVATHDPAEFALVDDLHHGDGDCFFKTSSADNVPGPRGQRTFVVTLLCSLLSPN